MSALYSSSVMRRSALHYLSGKIISAVLTFTILVWLVRLLPVHEYGAYVIFMVGNELALGISSAGLPWIAARYLPEYRLSATKHELIAFILRILAWQTSLVIFMALMLFIVLDKYLGWVNLESQKDIATLFLFLMIFEGISRATRDNILGPMLLQGYAQISLVGKSSTFIFILITLLIIGDLPNLHEIVYIELASTIVGMCIALAGLRIYLRDIEQITPKEEWKEPALSHVWRTALNMYLSQMLAMLHSPQLFLIIMQKSMGNETVALLGFLRNIYDIVSRYLPATMFFSLVRPKLVASYVSDGGIIELTKNANIVGKLSLLVLTPAIAFAIISGDRFIALLSGAKFPESGLLFFGFMLVLIPYSQRQLLETVAVTTGNSVACLKAAVSGPLTLPLLLLMIYTGFGPWSIIIALGIGYTVFNLVVLAIIWEKAGYRTDNKGLSELAVAGIATYLATFWVPDIFPGSLGVVFSSVVVAIVFAFIAFLIKPFSPEERRRINKLAKRRVFFW